MKTMISVPLPSDLMTYQDHREWQKLALEIVTDSDSSVMTVTIIKKVTMTQKEILMTETVNYPKHDVECGYWSATENNILE